MAEKIKKGESLARMKWKRKSQVMEEISMLILLRKLQRALLEIENLSEICEPRVEDLLGEKMKNKFRKSNFQSFPQGWKVCDENNVPPYLNYLHEEMGGNVTATISKDMNDLFYPTIDEMHRIQLEDMNENVILKWGFVMREAKKMGVGHDKSCPHQEDTMTREHVECQPCQKTEALMKSVDAEEKSSLKFSDFPRLHEEFKKKSDDTSVPACMDYVEKGIGRDIAAGSIFGDDILVLARSLFCAAIDEMHNMKLEDINEALMRKWGFVFRDCKKMDLDVEFAEEHLKKIAHAYFVSLMEEEEEEGFPELDVICSMSSTECFDDGAPLSKGILSSAPMEPTRAP